MGMGWSILNRECSLSDIAISSVSYVSKKQQHIGKLTRLQYYAYLRYQSLLQLYTAVSILKQRELLVDHIRVERRLSFTVVVAPASGNWKHQLPLKIIFSAYFQWLLF